MEVQVRCVVVERLLVLTYLRQVVYAERTLIQVQLFHLDAGARLWHTLLSLLVEFEAGSLEQSCDT